ncbi:hypothetical protein [Rufibacter hautae]|uniref:Lipoprotein n=1 Tax=Rufibacter hautae TaxID=2595005 RepID=A0A5B6TCB3_9BACT|nr:hypothetical protein [Rufibacter hautae]KAA3438107.1 hypothetical protein FOA19_12620 [Rufibacter hautae]
MKRILLFVVLLTSLLSSCGDNEITRDLDRMGYQYYPLEVGRFWVFNVTENEYSRNQITKTTTFQTRELIKDITTDQTGREWFRVEVSRRNSPDGSWTVNGVKLISLSSSDLRILENNQTTVHMVFPVKEGYSFVSNAFKNEDHEDPVYFTYTNLGKAFLENSQTYENTLTLVQAESKTFIELEKRNEVLALGVGPVSRTNKDYTYCEDSSGATCPYGEDYIITGSDRVETLESSGKVD